MRHAPDRLDALTGLRFVAAAAVLVSHLQVWLRRSDWDLGTLGSSGVGFFFVLSGFILSHVYRRDIRNVDTSAFYLARFARVWPLHAACLASMIAANGVQPAVGAADAAWRVTEHALLLQSWTTDIHWAHSLNGPAWSLSVEALFYALFPLLARLGARGLLLAFAACWCGNAAVYAMLDAAPASEPAVRAAWECVAVTAPPMRLQEFLLGICAHALWQGTRSARARPVGIAVATALEVLACCAVVASFRAFSSSGLGPAWIDAPDHEASLLAMARGPGLSFAFAALICVCAEGRGLVSKALGCAPMRYLGEISYAFYLVHTLTLMLTTRHFDEQGLQLAWAHQAAFGTAMAIGAAALLHATVEAPCRQALLARGASLVQRARIATSAAAKACREPAFLAATSLGAAGLAWAAFAPPTLADVGAALAGRGPDALRDIPFGASCRMVGALTESRLPAFCVCVVLREEAGADHQAVLEARDKQGAVVHTFVPRSKRHVDGDGATWTVVTSDADLAQLAGSSMLTLTIRGADGEVVAPARGPTTGDGRMLELFRLPW